MISYARLTKLIWKSVGFAAAIYLAIVYLQADRIDLVASSEVALEATVAPSATEPTIVYIMKPGDHLPVIRCVDTKSLLVPEVRLPDGGIGFAFKGDFAVTKVNWKVVDFPFSMAFGCRPFLRLD